MEAGLPWQAQWMDLGQILQGSGMFEGLDELELAKVAKKGPGATVRVVVSLGSGQLTGEIALIDRGPRTATVRASSEPTEVQVIRDQDFEALCEQESRIGYLVMRNLAQPIWLSTCVTAT